MKNISEGLLVNIDSFRNVEQSKSALVVAHVFHLIRIRHIWNGPVVVIGPTPIVPIQFFCYIIRVACVAAECGRLVDDALAKLLEVFQVIAHRYPP